MLVEGSDALVVVLLRLDKLASSFRFFVGVLVDSLSSFRLSLSIVQGPR